MSLLERFESVSSLFMKRALGHGHMAMLLRELLAWRLTRRLSFREALHGVKGHDRT